MLDRIKFSIFEGLNGVNGSLQTTPTNQLTFKELVSYYKSDKNKALSQSILDAKNKDEQNLLKNKRAYFTPSGVFTKRNNKSIVHHNNIISIDIDGLETKQDAEQVRSNLAKHPSVLFALLSTRGKGVKALMLVDKTYTPDDQHKQLKNVFKPYLAEFLNIDAVHIDSAQFVLSQPCYFSYDAKMYVNEDAVKLELDFNYKEPTPAPYKKVSVPADSKNRVDAYLLSVLNGKIEKLTPDGARHPKLNGIKLLGQYLHYAPHLENYFLSEFINAGVAMYGKASMRGNVTKSVNDAFRKGINEPQNNSTIDSILIKQTPQATSVFKGKKSISYKLNHKYLSQDRDFIELTKSTISKNKFSIITAPTGTGKSFLFGCLSEEMSEQFVFLAPLKTIIEQQQDKYPTIKQGTTIDQIARAEASNLLFATYSSAYKLESVKGKVLVIDESHLLVDRSNILTNEQRTIYKLMNEASRVVFVSATTNQLLAESFDAQELKVNIEAKKQEIQPLFYDPKETKQIDAILGFIKSNNDGVNVVFFNDKSKLKQIKSDILRLGLLNENQIVKFTADPLDILDENYNLLVKNQVVKQETKLILATSKIGEGVNIKNNSIFNILVVGNKDTNYFTQSIGRFREASKLNVYTLFSSNFKGFKGLSIDELGTYNSLKNEVQNAPVDFKVAKNKPSNNLPIKNLDWKQNAIIHLQDLEAISNDFEIMHQVKVIKESYFSFNLWKQEIEKLNSSFVFCLGVDVRVKRNLALEKGRKEKREERSNFLGKVRDVLNSDDADYILALVNKNTKNNNLKYEIKQLYEPIPSCFEFTEDEEILFFENFDTIERYISNIIELLEVTNKSYSDVMSIYLSNGNYKATKYSLLIKQLVTNVLKEKGATNINEAKMLQTVSKVDTVFSSFFKDTDAPTFSRNKIFNILRTELNYRLKSEDITTLNNKIGFLFGVKYNKKTKLFTLKRWVPIYDVLYKKETETRYPIKLNGSKALRPLNKALNVSVERMSLVV